MLFSTTPNLCMSSIWTTHRTTNVWLQNPIFKHLHHHAISNMFTHDIFETHCAQILSCFGLGASTLLIIQLIFPTFFIIFPIFSTMFQTWLGLHHPSIASIFWSMCTHIIDPMGIHLLGCAHSNEHTRTHNAVHNNFAAIMRNVGFLVGTKTTTCASFNYIQFFSPTIQHCAHQRWHLRFNQCCHYQPNMGKSTFPNLHKYLLSLMWFKSKKGTIVNETPLMNSSL
jgi:hypothetical protein